MPHTESAVKTRSSGLHRIIIVVTKIFRWCAYFALEFSVFIMKAATLSCSSFNEAW